jgi:hypothetical protein
MFRKNFVFIRKFISEDQNIFYFGFRPTGFSILNSTNSQGRKAGFSTFVGLLRMSRILCGYMLSKQIRMRPCSYKAKLAAIDAIYQQPVPFNMALPAILECPFEWMISVPGPQRFSVDQTFNDILKFIQVLSTPDQSLDISFELGISPDRAHTFRFPGP